MVITDSQEIRILLVWPRQSASQRGAQRKSNVCRKTIPGSDTHRTGIYTLPLKLHVNTIDYAWLSPFAFF